MRNWVIVLIAGAVLSTGACSCGRQPAADKANNGDTVAEKMGRAAYKATQKTKQAAKKAAKELKQASREAREGWNEAKQKDQEKKK